LKIGLREKKEMGRREGGGVPLFSLSLALRFAKKPKKGEISVSLNL
tara:strand:+ start:864 stop:1001 length:138 start_codon:yes stop_codon:yes gene_type:complete